MLTHTVVKYINQSQIEVDSTEGISPNHVLRGLGVVASVDSAIQLTFKGDPQLTESCVGMEIKIIGFFPS